MRVIAGRLGGRTLAAPAGRRTRPTSDRVREALFSILGDLRETRVLDLYAGTGAVGIEALSRGAERATFVEHAKPALTALRRNLVTLELHSEAEMLPMRVERALPQLASTSVFDVIFADPPYADFRAFTSLLQTILEDPTLLLPAGGRLVLEHAKADVSPSFPTLELQNTRVYGDTSLSFYLRVAP